MPRFFFDGFASGTAVAVSAVQGAFTESGSVSTWGQTGLASVDITQIIPNELVAPAGIWFEASNASGFDVTGPGVGEVYDPTAHEITWIWDFDDPGTFATPLNMPGAWNDKNVDYGQKTYHVFDTPGTYNVRVWGIDQSGNTGEHTVPVTILDPEVVYSGTRTICVSNQNDFTGAPAGAQLVTTLDTARLRLSALGQTGRILLRAGETFQEQFFANNSMINLRVGSFGAGAKPVLVPPPVPANYNTAVIFGLGNGNTVIDSVFYGLRFQGDWDAARETGDPRGSGINYTAHNTVPFHALTYQCEFDGMGSQYYDALNDNDHLMASVDCDYTNWRDYGVWFGAGLVNYLDNKRMALVGCAVHQKQNACRNGQGKIGLGNDHGPLRYVDNKQAVISTCDFYSANSWAIGVQPCIRLAQADNNNPGGYFLNMNRVVCEGGNIGGIDGQNNGAPERPGNHVFDKFIFLSDYSTDNGFTAAFGGCTFRNGIIVRQDMTYQSTGQFSLMNFAVDNPQGGNGAAPMNLYNMTFLNLTATSFGGGIVANLGNFSNVTYENNVIHEPSLGTPNTPAAPIGLTASIEGVAPRNLGERVSVEKVLVAGVSVPSGGTIDVPYPAGTSTADFSPSGRHTVLISGSYYFSYRGECSLSFGGGNITITNTSGDTWSGDLRIGLDQETLVTNTTYASPGSVPLPVPEAGSNALLNEGGFLAYGDFLGDVRDGPWKGAV